MIEPNLLRRLNALLDRPQAFLVYNGGEGGEFLSNRIGQYSSIHTHARNTKVSVDTTYNRTAILYPEIYQCIVNRLPLEVGNRENLISILESEEVVTEGNLLSAEQFFDQAGVPLFRMHRVISEMFQQHPTHFLITSGPWRAYAGALTVIKVRCSLDQFLSHAKIRQYLDLEGEYSIPQVREYMRVQGLVEAPFMIYLALIIKKSAHSLGIGETFALNGAELYHRYFDQEEYRKRQEVTVGYVRHAVKHGGKLLELSRIVNDPRYLADQFDIQDWPGFYKGIRQWHDLNLDLLWAHGFTEFETLRIS